MTDITDKSFTITGFLKDGKKKFHEVGHEITSVGHGVTQALDLDCYKITIQVEICCKKAPFICPDCKSTDCQTDHWDFPGGWCCICGEQNCTKKTVAAHRPRCKRTKDHKGNCKG